jgi:hypothetical protein
VEENNVLWLWKRTRRNCSATHGRPVLIPSMATSAKYGRPIELRNQTRKEISFFFAISDVLMDARNAILSVVRSHRHGQGHDGVVVYMAVPKWQRF